MIWPEALAIEGVIRGIGMNKAMFPVQFPWRWGLVLIVTEISRPSCDGLEIQFD